MTDITKQLVVNGLSEQYLKMIQFGHTPTRAFWLLQRKAYGNDMISAAIEAVRPDDMYKLDYTLLEMIHPGAKTIPQEDFEKALEWTLKRYGKSLSDLAKLGD